MPIHCLSNESLSRRLKSTVKYAKKTAASATLIKKNNKMNSFLMARSIYLASRLFASVSEMLALSRSTSLNSPLISHSWGNRALLGMHVREGNCSPMSSGVVALDKARLLMWRGSRTTVATTPTSTGNTTQRDGTITKIPSCAATACQSSWLNSESSNSVIKIGANVKVKPSD